MSSYKINIAKPCTEDWDKMTQTDEGKHCASCNKIVIDFTGMSNDEIIQMLLKKKGQKICGNFFNTQIERPIVNMVKSKRTYWPAIAAMMVAGLFSVTTHQTQAQVRTKTAYVTRSTKEKYTEPATDSSNVYMIKIFSKTDLIGVAGATLTIKSLGSFTADQSGVITLTIEESKIPSILQIELVANGYQSEKVSIKKSVILEKHQIELFMVERERYMLKGDIKIDEMN